MTVAKEKLNKAKSFDILEIIKNETNLKATEEGYYKGNCPFCGENSFTVNPKNQYYYCFNCKEGGDVITFTQKYYDLNLKKAVNKLCDK